MGPRVCVHGHIRSSVQLRRREGPMEPPVNTSSMRVGICNSSPGGCPLMCFMKEYRGLTLARLLFKKLAVCVFGILLLAPLLWAQQGGAKGDIPGWPLHNSAP